MIILEEFKKYFNRDFWRAFRDKGIFFEVPGNNQLKNLYIEKLYNNLIKFKYCPSPPIINIIRNKGNGVARVVPVFSLKDYCIYYFCIKRLERIIAYNRIPNTFGGWTLGGLLRKSEDDEMDQRKNDFDHFEDSLSESYGVSISEYSFNPLAWTKSYGDLNAKLYATSKEENYEFVVEFDIANYYDSIRLDLLEARIREAADREDFDIINLLFYFLNYWNRDINLYNKQTVGIPQDAMGDCSRILANFYLQPYDNYIYDLCEKNNCKYLRYADDQFIFSKDKEILNYLIFKASKNLNRLGLSVNQKKVRILTTKELINYRSYEIFDIINTESDKKDKIKVERFVDGYLEILDSNGLRNIKNNGFPMLSKILSCPALKEIDFSKFVKLLSSCLDIQFLEQCRSYYFEKIYLLLSEANKRRFIKKLMQLSCELIHNAFHYQLLTFLVKFKLDTELILKRIKELEDI